MKTLKVLSALLTYPTQDLLGASEEFKELLHGEAALPPKHLQAILGFIDDLAGHDLFDAQERYVFLFDRTRSLSLHLFEHVHGESRDRGQAMVDLLKMYEDAGYAAVQNELPDFVPLFLEFASTREPAAAIELIGQPAHVFAALHERLQKRNSPYASVLSALIALSRVKPDEELLCQLRHEPDPDPDDLEALDAAWEEEEVIFGPGSADDCGKDELAARLRQATRPADGVTKPTRSGPQIVLTKSSKTGQHVNLNKT